MSDGYNHAAFFVEEAQNGDRTQTGQFCNDACLSIYIDANELTDGACYRIDR